MLLTASKTILPYNPKYGLEQSHPPLSASPLEPKRSSESRREREDWEKLCG